MNCPGCGLEVDADSRFCKQCAFDLSKPALESEATIVTAKSQQPAKTKLTLLLAGIGIVALLVVGLIGGYLYRRHRAQASTATNSSSTPSGPTVSDRAKQVEDRILRGETLSENDIAGLSPYELRVLRNVHFARYGRKYDQGGELGSYFYTRPWYKPHDDYKETSLTQTDKDNVKLILAIEKLAATPYAASSVEPVPTSPPQVSKTELNRESVLSVLQRTINRPVRAFFSANSWVAGHPNYTDVYSQMIDEGVITCRVKNPNCCWQGCRPGPRSGNMTTDGLDIFLTIGSKVPIEVTGISQTDQSSAIADFVLSYKASGDLRIYNKYRQIFFGEDIRQQNCRAFLRLYDDGWRVESWH